jgi:hypothetical protein
MPRIQKVFLAVRVARRVEIGPQFVEDEPVRAFGDLLGHNPFHIFDQDAAGTQPHRHADQLTIQEQPRRIVARSPGLGPAIDLARRPAKHQIDLLAARQPPDDLPEFVHRHLPDVAVEQLYVRVVGRVSRGCRLVRLDGGERPPPGDGEPGTTERCARNVKLSQSLIRPGQRRIGPNEASGASDRRPGETPRATPPSPGTPGCAAPRS